MKIGLCCYGGHSFSRISRKKAAVSSRSLEWQFPHDDYKPRERPAAEAAQRPAGAAAASASAVVHITRPEESPLAKLQLSKGPQCGLSVFPAKRAQAARRGARPQTA